MTDELAQLVHAAAFESSQAQLNHSSARIFHLVCHDCGHKLQNPAAQATGTCDQCYLINDPQN
jgi:protein-arginine kinase activator protein McsA